MSAVKKTKLKDFMPPIKEGAQVQVVCTVNIEKKKRVQAKLEKEGRTLADLIRASFDKYLEE